MRERKTHPGLCQPGLCNDEATKPPAAPADSSRSEQATLCCAGRGSRRRGRASSGSRRRRRGCGRKGASSSSTAPSPPCTCARRTTTPCAQRRSRASTHACFACRCNADVLCLCGLQGGDSVAEQCRTSERAEERGGAARGATHSCTQLLEAMLVTLTDLSSEHVSTSCPSCGSTRQSRIGFECIGGSSSW